VGGIRICLSRNRIDLLYPPSFRHPTAILPPSFRHPLREAWWVCYNEDASDHDKKEKGA